MDDILEREYIDQINAKKQQINIMNGKKRIPTVSAGLITATGQCKLKKHLDMPQRSDL